MGVTRSPAERQPTPCPVAARAGFQFRQCDVSDASAVQALIDGVVQEFGRLDCLVNNAIAFGGWKAIDEIDLELAERLLRTNILGYFVSAQRALPHLRRSKGTIVNVSSLGGELGLWHDSIYSASKGGITALTRSLAVDEAIHGVRVNAILPGNILSDARTRAEAASAQPEKLHDYIERWQWMGRSGTIDEVGMAALFLATPMSSFCTGISLVISGGLELGLGVKEPYMDFGWPIKEDFRS